MADTADTVVIVGMACRYPEADDPEQLWQNVMSARRSFRPLPPQRLPLAEYGGPGSDQVYLTRAAVLDGWTFDRQRFRVPGETFRAVDLTHWLALEVCAAALADAGLPDGDGLDRSRVGVVLGNSLTGEFSRAAALRTRWPYVRRAVAAALAGTPLAPAAQAELLAAVEHQYKAPFPAPSDETLAGALANTIAGRVCNYYDFRGTGYTVDGACASSLLAVAAAAAAVADGQLDLALAGGVDLSLDPFELVGFSRVGALATGEMRVYDRRPTGFLPGEGCGVVALCRQSYARARGLRPYARLLGWGTSSDGNGGLTRPEAAGQQLALARAYDRAGLAPSEVALVEGHGTGTEVGDTAELRALLDVRGEAGQPAVLGSIKANIGHTKAAAGVAGLLKAALALHREVLPPTTGCVDPHPLLADGPASLAVTDEARPWPGASRYASVSAMGFGGINAHAVLGGVAAGTRRRLSRPERRLAARHPDREVLVCTAGQAGELAARLQAIQAAAREMSRGELTDLAATLAASERGDAPARFATAAADPADLVAAAGHALDRLAEGTETIMDRSRRVFLAVGAPLRVGLLFSGQAAPCYPDPGALGDLLEALPPGYRDRLPIPPGGPVGTAVAQPAIVRACLAGLRWLDALGVKAQQAVGHSLGEIPALVWGGALTEAEAYQLATARGAAMADASTVPAGMASLGADLATVTALVGSEQARRADRPPAPGPGAGDGEGGVVVAADNATHQVVVSGARAEVAAVLERARRAGIAATWLPVPHAFHSPLMAPAADRVRAAAARIGWRRPALPVASTVTGQWWRDEDPVELLARQLTAPVRFREALAALDADLLVEVGPGRILANLVGERAVPLDAGAASADGIATATAALFAAGAVDTVEPYVAHRFTRRFALGRARQFLTNPCEVGAPAVAELAAVAASPAPPGGEPGVGAVADATQDPVTAIPAVPGGRGDPAVGASGDRADPVAATVGRVAAALELDPAVIPREARLLADLHLSSLRVTQLVAEVAADLGRAVPATALPLATATVEELAGAVAALPGESGAAQPASGVAPWVRALTQHLVPRPASDQDSPLPHRWEIVGDLAGHPLATAVHAAFPPGEGGAPARLLALPPGLADIPVADVVAALRAGHADRQPLAVLHHGGIGAAVGRSLAAEVPDVPVLVVEVPPDGAGVALAAAEARRGWQGYTEVVFGADRRRTVPVVRSVAVPPRSDGAIPLAAGEACLVTGGAKGIGIECAVAVAAATGARMVLVGRSPADDREVRGALARVAATGAAAAYHRVDLTDPGAVAAVAAEIRERYGPVRALLHAAGQNEPRAIADLTADQVHAALAAKASGLDHLLAALDLTELRFGVTFGSVIGRTGLAGEAAYAIANEWLARRCAELAASCPHVRWLNIEWSAWSGTGMGVRLGALDGLVRQGLSPIAIDDGVSWLLRLLSAPGLPPTVVVTGRLPATATLRWAEDAGSSAGADRGGRFLESPASHTPGVELVAAADLSLGTDPYLVDHRIDGTPVLPAALGLEAMAQACVALGAKPVPASYQEVSLARPITVPVRGHRGMQVAALAREDGGIDLVARSEETGFRVDHFRATHTAPIEDSPATDCPEPVPFGALIAAQPLYGPLFFHGPRFHRVRGFHAVSAYRCVASIAADPEARWFGGFLDQHLELGDPGARDAYLHALQVCVPDRRVLPVGVEQIRVYRRPEGQLLLVARQRDEDGDSFVFDVAVHDAGRSMVEEWRGLTLRAIGPVMIPAWPVALLGPYLTRTLRRWRPAVALDLTVATAAGRPGGVATAASQLADRVLLAAGAGAVDWQRAAPRRSDDEVPAELARLTGESADTVALRVRSCREVLRRWGAAAAAPVAVEEVGPAGWVCLASGARRLYSAVVETTAGTVTVCAGAEGR